MMFPKGLHYKKQKDLFDWWGFGITFPFISSGEEYDMGTTSYVFAIYASTAITFSKCEFYHKFQITLLGFGFWYAKQWGY